MTGDLISREALMQFPIRIDHYDRVHGSEEFVLGIETVLEYAQNLPAVEAVPVVHGRWIHTTTEDDDWGGTFHHYACSVCGWSMGGNPEGWGKYCPNCGAKMDKEA